MSPKRRVALVVAIFATLGVGVSVGIIAINGGFERPPDFFDPPTAEDIWVVGNGLEDGSSLEYSLTAYDKKSSLQSALVSINFNQDGNTWDVTFVINNGTGMEFENTIKMSKELTREGPLDESFRSYFDPIQSSIFAVRDMEYGQSPKYLVVGAPWNEIFYKSSQVIVRVTDKETVQTTAGSFDAFVLSYKLEEITSKIWVVQGMPLPVKAEVYDAEDELQYQYELTRVSNI